MTVIQKEFLTPAEATRLFSLPTTFLKLHRRRNTGPPYVKISGKPGQRSGRVLYRTIELINWMQNCPRGGDPSGHEL